MSKKTDESEQVVIRRAVPADAERMAHIHARSWEVAYRGIIPDEAIARTSARRLILWNEILSESGGSHKFAICECQVIVGLLVLGDCRDHDSDGQTLEIFSIYLLPEYFGKGFGTAALDYALRWAGEQGYRSLSAWVLEENHRARRFYEKCGLGFHGTKKEVVIGKPLVEMRYVATYPGRYRGSKCVE